jgi:hypothetical protein
MGMNKYSSQSFEEMAEEQDSAEVKNTPAEEPKAETVPTEEGNAKTE